MALNVKKEDLKQICAENRTISMFERFSIALWKFLPSVTRCALMSKRVPIRLPYVNILSQILEGLYTYPTPYKT